MKPEQQLQNNLAVDRDLALELPPRNPQDIKTSSSPDLTAAFGPALERKVPTEIAPDLSAKAKLGLSTATTQEEKLTETGTKVQNSQTLFSRRETKPMTIFDRLVRFLAKLLTALHRKLLGGLKTAATPKTGPIIKVTTQEKDEDKLAVKTKKETGNNLRL